MSKTIIKVEAYSGYRADERPISFSIGKKVFMVKDVLDRWYGTGHDYFKVLAGDGYIYIIRHDRNIDEWELVMMEKAEGAGAPLEGNPVPEEAGEAKLYSFNLLVSYSWRNFRRVRDEIAVILREFGDPGPIIEKTLARGICGVSTSLDAREAVKKVRALCESNPMCLGYTIKWAPADRWCEASIEEMKKALEKEKGKIKKGEKWAMKVEKRYAAFHSIDIIKELAALIDEPVDLDNPDKIVRVELLGKNACITVVRPDEVFSTAKAH